MVVNTEKTPNEIQEMRGPSADDALKARERLHLHKYLSAAGAQYRNRIVEDLMFVSATFVL